MVFWLFCEPPSNLVRFAFDSTLCLHSKGWEPFRPFFAMCGQAFLQGTTCRITPAANKKAPETVRNQGLAHLVAKGGIEPPTQGFSILCSTD
jgi:hypothetical protein